MLDTSPERLQVAKMLDRGGLARSRALSIALLWHAMPRALLDSLSLPVLQHDLSVLDCSGRARRFVGRSSSPSGGARHHAPGGWDGAMTVLAAPLVFVLASWVALKIAEPYMLEELATQVRVRRGETREPSEGR